MEPRRRRIRATYKQLNLLVKFMSDNPDLVKGVNYRTAFGKHYHDAKWMELANLLNSQENGMNKSPREWNRYWKDLKSGIKKKVHAMNKKMSHSKPFLSSIEQTIYKNMCNSKRRKNNTVNERKNSSYLQIPTESDTEQAKYEIEYLEDSSCDDAQITNVSDMDPVENYIDFHDADINGLKLELIDRNVETLVNQDHLIIDKILNESKSAATTILKLDKETGTAIKNKISINKNNDAGINTDTNGDKNADVLTDIRNNLRELVAIQKDRARSELRLACANERRAILEEKRVRIEERRIKMEERRVALEERKMEALERNSFAHERLASAAERKNEITEHRMSNIDFVLR